MITRNSSGQTFSPGDHFFNMNVYRVSDDSPQVTTVVCKDGPLYVVQMEGSKILNFSVDGRNIPMESLGQYQAVIDSIKVRVKEAELQAKRDRAQAELDRVQAGRDREQADRDREQAEKDRQQAEKNRDQAEQSRDQASRDREQAERDRAQASRDREQAERDREQAERDRKRAEEDRKMMESLIKDLIADGIVTDRDSIHSLKVDADEVIVNGKRLPEALEKKYITKYVKQGFSMSFHQD
jgi:chromosome segregation ATPase